MELLTALVVGVLFSVGTYMLLSKNVLRVVLGTIVISYGINLMLLTSGQLKRGAAPVIDKGFAVYADPLPQALILTAIVINFAVTAFMFVLAYRTVQEHGTDNLEELRGLEHE
jgi:multicomponent Na+:H+ antiporter subunit C